MKTYSLTAFVVWLVASQAHGINVVNQLGEAIDAQSEVTVVSTTSPFDVMGGSTLVVTLTAESAGFPGGSTPPGASGDRVFFGRQPMSLAGTTTNGGSNPTTQITEIWYLHNPWDHEADIRVEWNPGNGTGVSGTGFGVVSLTNAAQTAPAFFGNELGLSVDLTGLSDDLVIAAAVANDSSDDVMAGVGLTELYGSTTFPDPRTGGVGSARAASAFANNVTGDFTAEFMLGFFGGVPSRPAASAAAFDAGPFVSPTAAPLPGDTDGDGDLDADDYNSIRANIGADFTAALGTLPSAGNIVPDVTGFDGLVDIEDLQFFLSEFQAAGGDLASLAVPEPTALALAALVATVLTGFRTRA